MSVGMYCPSQPWICSGTTAFEAVLPRHPPAPDSLAICVASVVMPRPGHFVGEARTIVVLPCVATDSRLMVDGALPSRAAPSTSIHRLSEHVRSLLALPGSALSRCAAGPMVEGCRSLGRWSGEKCEVGQKCGQSSEGASRPSCPLTSMPCVGPCSRFAQILHPHHSFCLSGG